MAKGGYMGASDASRKIKTMYIGVDNVARKIKKGYMGIGDAAHEIFSGINWILYEYSTPIPQTSTTLTFEIQEDGGLYFYAYGRSYTQDQYARGHIGMQFPITQGQVFSMTIDRFRWAGSYSDYVSNNAYHAFYRSDGTIIGSANGLNGYDEGYDFSQSTYHNNITRSWTAPANTAFIRFYVSGGGANINMSGSCEMIVRSIRINGVEQTLT